MVCAFTGNEGDHDQGQKTEGTAHHVGLRTLEGLLEGFGDTSVSSCAHAFYQMRNIHAEARRSSAQTDDIKGYEMPALCKAGPMEDSPISYAHS